MCRLARARALTRCWAVLLALALTGCGSARPDSTPTRPGPATTPAPVERPAPPPPPPGVDYPGAARPDSDEGGAVFWNAWFEVPSVAGQSSLHYRAQPSLPAGRPVLLGLHLSRLLYEGAALKATVSPAFGDELKRWLRTSEQTASVTAIIVLDTRFFEGNGLVQRTLSIDLNRLRLALASPAPEGSPFDLLSGGDLSFVFAEDAVPLRTKQRAGRAGISILIWDDHNRPLEEFGGSICIGEGPCPPALPISSANQRASALAVGEADPGPFDAVLHVFRMERTNSVSLYGLIHTSEGKLVWSLGRHPDSMRALLAGSLFQAFARANTDEQWLAHGTALRNLLFPGAEARAAYTRLLRAISRPGDALPRVYIRMLDGDVAPVLFPLGALTVDGLSLAQRADIVLPLRVQSYVRPTECISDWQIVAPPKGIGDPALDDVTGQASLTLQTWRTKSRWPPPDSLESFARWLDGGDPLPTSVIFILAHHDQSGLLRFTSSDVLTPASASRRIAEPTVVIFNACGTTQASAANFVDELNAQGASAFIATITEVEAPLAADFMNCLDAELATSEAGGARLSDVFRRTTRCVMDIKDGVVTRHGLKALKYVLVGDAEVNICRPG